MGYHWVRLTLAASWSTESQSARFRVMHFHLGIERDSLGVGLDDTRRDLRRTEILHDRTGDDAARVVHHDVHTDAHFGHVERSELDAMPWPHGRGNSHAAADDFVYRRMARQQDGEPHQIVDEV